MLVADFEVFKHNWMMVAYDLVNQEKIEVIDDRNKLLKIYEKYKDDLWVFYNGRSYDQWIFKAIICGFDPKEVNDFIIVQGRKGHEFSSMLNRVKLNIYDAMTMPVSLKVLEGFIGSDIRETTVPFDIDRPLTKEEIAEVLFYCEHDVNMLGIVLNNKESMKDFNAQWGLLHMFNLPMSDMGRTKAQLGAKILGASRPIKPREDDIDFSIPETIKIEKYKYVIDWFRDMQRKARRIKRHDGLEDAVGWMYKQKLETVVAGVDTIFAWGGLHGSVRTTQEDGYFYDIDASSFYPAIMIEYGLLSRNVRDPNKFVEIRDSRLVYKRAGDKRANSLKLLINSVYGASGDKYNNLFDNKRRNEVCIYGQLLLLDLVEHLESVCDMRAYNTDGITIKLRATNDEEAKSEFAKVVDVCQEWERRTRIDLEYNGYRKIIIRDVNNYVMLPHGDLFDDKGNPRWKSKGGVVKKLHDLDYDLPIVNRAVVNYLTQGIPTEETVGCCTELRDFQKIYKVSGKYMYAMHNGKRLTEKVFRVFASKRSDDTALFKVKDKGVKGLVPEKFAECPNNCFIDNTDVTGKPLPEYLDKTWYIELANKRIKEFLYGK